MKFLKFAFLTLGLCSLATTAHSDEKQTQRLRKAFDNYIQTIRDVEENLLSRGLHENGEADLVGAYDLIFGNLQINLRSHVSSSGTSHRGRPRFASFDDPDTRVGIDNPDTQYMTVTIHNDSGNDVFRVYGKRGNATDFLLQVFDPTSGTGGGATLRDEFMKYGGNGFYEVFLSTKEKRNPKWANWMEIPAANNINIIRRLSHCDWMRERPADVHIERVGTGGVINKAPTVDQMVQQIEDATKVYKEQTPFFVNFFKMIKKALPANFAPPWQSTGDIGQVDQFSLQMWYKLKEDQALIISMPEPEARYYGLQASNFWGSSFDWQHNQTSLSWGLGGKCQAEQTKDKMYHVVVSAKDPGVKNWINIQGYPEGGIIGRLQGVTAKERAKLLKKMYKPTSKVVPLSEVRKHLPKDTKKFTSSMRKRQILIRQEFARKKYRFW